MTIGIGVKVHDGIVLASDSASTVYATSPDGASGVFNVYERADKIFNLHKGLPIGLMTWGSGSIGPASIAALSKDLRRRLTVEYDGQDRITFDLHGYAMGDVAQIVCDYFYDEHYGPAFGQEDQKPPIGFFVAGYSAGDRFPELWRIEFGGDDKPTPEMIRAQENTGINWAGEIEPINRLVLGHGTGLQAVLAELGVPADQIAPAMTSICNKLEIPMAPPPMPIQDAIDLAEFLVETAVRYARFRPGPSTVGGPIDIAAITPHESFRWVKRKHYYTKELNPED